MSVHLSSQVWKLKTPDAATKLVLLKLADNANDDGECWPSLTTIARETGLGRSTVCRKLLYLGAVGALSKVPGHTGVSTRYKLEIKPGNPSLRGSPTVRLVPPRDQPSPTVALGVVPQWDGVSATVGHQPSLNHQLNHQLTITGFGENGNGDKSTLQLRLGKLFGRRPSTKWSQSELKALKSIDPDEDDLKLLEAYYTANIPKSENIRRRDLATLLNNFNGEIDRARNFKHPQEDFRA